MNYQDSKIGFVCSANVKPSPAPVMAPAPEVRMLRNELAGSIVYAALLEREVLRLAAKTEGREFYLN